jgi:hypothetical protein
MGGLDLGAVYPPCTVPDDQLWAAVTKALLTHERFLLDWLDSPPQTNEVRRAAAIIPAAALAAHLSGLPLAVSELGASGGLNLGFDRYSVQAGSDHIGPDNPVLALAPDWRGDTPVGTMPTVATRRGVDLSPIDPRSEGGRLKLMAYLWPDQLERMRMTRAAINAADTKVIEADAADWLEGEFALQTGVAQFLFHTIAWQYFPQSAQKRARDRIEALGSAATKNAPLAWFSMEKGDMGPGAKLTLRYWPGNLTFDLGHADFHGRWIDWRAPLEAA